MELGNQLSFTQRYRGIRRMIDYLDDPVVAYLQVEIRRSGALSVAGAIGNEQYAVNALQSAIDAVKNHHKREKTLIVPGSATGLESVA